MVTAVGVDGRLIISAVDETAAAAEVDSWLIVSAVDETAVSVVEMTVVGRATD